MVVLLARRFIDILLFFFFFKLPSNDPYTKFRGEPTPQPPLYGRRMTMCATIDFFPPNFQNGQYFVPLLKYILVCINAHTHALLRSNDAPPGALPPLTLHYACRFCVQTGKILPSLYYCNILYCAHNITTT